MRLYDDGELTYCVDEDVSGFYRNSIFHCCGNELNKQTVLPTAKHSLEIDCCDSELVQCIHITPTHIKQSYMQYSCIDVTINPDNRLI